MSLARPVVCRSDLNEDIPIIPPVKHHVPLAALALSDGPESGDLARTDADGTPPAAVLPRFLSGLAETRGSGDLSGWG